MLVYAIVIRGAASCTDYPASSVTTEPRRQLSVHSSLLRPSSFPWSNGDWTARPPLSRSRPWPRSSRPSTGTSTTAASRPRCFCTWRYGISPLTPRGRRHLPAVRISRVRVYYSLLRLIGGGRPLDAVTRVDIRDTSLRPRDLARIDFARRPAGEARGGEGGLQATLAAGLAALPGSLEVTGTNLSLSLTVAGTDVRVRRLFVKARRAGDQVSLQINRASIETSGADFPFRAQIAPHRPHEPGPREARCRAARRRVPIGLPRAEPPGLPDPARVGLASAFAASATRRRSICSSRSTRRAPASTLRTQAYNPRTLVSFDGPLAFLNQYTRASITMNSAAEYSLLGVPCATFWPSTPRSAAASCRREP